MKLLKAHWAWLAASPREGPLVLAPPSASMEAQCPVVGLCLCIDFNSRYGVGQGDPVSRSPLFKLGDSAFLAWV